MSYMDFLRYLPEVADPVKKLTLKQKLKWTGLILVLYFFLIDIPLFGVTPTQASFFKNLELLLGAKIGSLLTLGIGPIVTASIVLQLLIGSKIVNIDLSTEEGKFIFNGTNKLLTIVFIFIEAFVYVKFGAITPEKASYFWMIVLQLMFGGLIVLFLDEVVKKYGIGSGISLFIAAGISKAIFIQTLSPFDTAGNWAYLFGGNNPAVGKIWAGLYYLSHPNFSLLLTVVLGPLFVTIALFFIIVYFQSINVEIPLSFGRIRGQSIKWPLNFFYAGVIPVILVSALSANLKLWAFAWEKLHHMAKNSSTFSLVVSYLNPYSIWTNLGNLFTFNTMSHILSYLIYMVIGSTLFSYLWVKTSGMDAQGQADQIIKSGLQIPGFRKDKRIIEKILDRYIIPLTILGGIGIGVLAAFANLFRALTTGTGILLLIMIIYQFYQQLSRESMEDLTLLRKIFNKSK